MQVWPTNVLGALLGTGCFFSCIRLSPWQLGFCAHMDVGERTRTMPRAEILNTGQIRARRWGRYFRVTPVLNVVLIPQSSNACHERTWRAGPRIWKLVMYVKFSISSSSNSLLNLAFFIWHRPVKQCMTCSVLNCFVEISNKEGKCCCLPGPYSNPHLKLSPIIVCSLTCLQ